MTSSHQHEDVVKPLQPLQLISTPSCSSTIVSEVQPSSPVESAERTNHRHRKTVSFSDVDVIVLPWTLMGPSGLPLELAWEPKDRYAVSVESMEQTRSMLDRFGDGTSPVDRFNRARNLKSSSRGSVSTNTTSLPRTIEVQEGPIKLAVEGEQHDHWGSMTARGIAMVWALVLICVCVMFYFLPPCQACPKNTHSFHQVLEKMMLKKPRTIEAGTETIKEVQEKKPWMKLFKGQ